MKKLLSAILAGVMLFSVATVSYSAYLDDYEYVLPKEYYDYPEFEWELKQGLVYLPGTVTRAANLWYRYEARKDGEVWPEEYLTVFEGYMDGAELGSDGFTLYGYEWKNGKLSVDFGATFDVKYNWSTGMSYTELYGPTADDYKDNNNSLAVAVTNKNDGGLVRMIDSDDTFIPELRYDEYNACNTLAWQFLSLEEAKAFEESKGMELEYTDECRKTVEISLPDDFSPELYDVTVYYVNGCQILGINHDPWKFSVPYEISLADYAPAGLTLAEGSRLVLDSATGYVDKIDGTITVGDLKANFTEDFTIPGKSDADFVATDDVIGDYKALIYGDVNRDGKVNLSDTSVILQKIAGWNVSLNSDAADVNKSGDVDLTDITKMLKKLADWDDISLGNVRLVFENEKLTAESESTELDLYFESPLIKTSSANTENTGKNSYKIKTARNETESCQFLISSVKDMEGLTVELSDFVHEYGEGTLTGETFIHYYYKMEVQANCLIENGPPIVEDDYFPEALLPLADSFEVKAGKSQGFTVNVTAGKDTPAGMYKAVLTVKDSEGKEIKQANLYAYVWDFTLPDTPYSKSSFGMSGFTIYSTLGGVYDKKWYSGDDYATTAAHYDFLLDHNISCYQLPYHITDPRADAYMSDPRVTSFEICGENLRFPDEDNWTQTMANWNKVQTNPVWAEKGHFYYVDEPQGESGAPLVKAQHEYITEKLGTDDFDIIIPFGNSMADYINNIDMLEFIKPYTDIMVPSSGGFMPNLEGNHYNEPLWTPRQAYNKFGESLPRLQAIKEDPDKELWWYVCVGPQFPYPNLFVNHQGIMTRVIWWQQFMYGPEGFLYWATQADWDKVIKCGGEYPTNGDGILMYLGAMFGYEQNIPVASWRLTQVRDGFDDFDYLKMAEELCGREAVMKLVNRLTTSVTTVKEEPALMEALRDEVAELIVANQK